MIEAKRFKLPCTENHRGRKPCEWRIGDFVIPKALTCVLCKEPKSTHKDAFITLCEKNRKEPQELVDDYICRSCRSLIKKGIDPASEEKPDSEYEDEKPDDPNDYISDIRDIKATPVTDKIEGSKVIGLVLSGEPIRFRLLAENIEHGMPVKCMTLADEVHDITLGICLIGDTFNGNQFFKSPIYDSTDMLKVCNEKVKNKT